MSVGGRVRRVITRLAGFTFGASLTLFEATSLRRFLGLQRQGGRPLTARGHDDDRVVPPPSTRRQVEARHGTAGPAPVGPRASVRIVFIHQNNSEHLRYSLAQAKKSNPNSTVYLLGDESNDQYPCVEHHRSSDYSVGAAQFAEVYTHYSTNGVDFELVCFQRWFILRDFLTARRIDQCVYLDSDVLLYADVTEEMKKFRRFDFTLCWHTIGCVFFLNRMDGLEDLCQFMLDVYTKKDRYQYDRMVAQFALRQKNQLPGGACDMTALQLYTSSISAASARHPTSSMGPSSIRTSTCLTRVSRWKTASRRLCGVAITRTARIANRSEHQVQFAALQRSGEIIDGPVLYGNPERAAGARGRCAGRTLRPRWQLPSRRRLAGTPDAPDHRPPTARAASGSPRFRRPRSDRESWRHRDVRHA